MNPFQSVLDAVGALFASILLLFGGCLPMGCSIDGHRKVTIEILGQRIMVEDEVNPNSQGETKYIATFDTRGWDLIGNWFRDAQDGPTETPAPEPVPTPVTPTP